MSDTVSILPDNNPADLNPCLGCGACCANFRVSFYCGEVTGVNGGTVPQELVTQITPLRVCMQGTEQGGRCTALRGVLGQPGIHCAIYPLRSSTCREFNAWEADGSVNPDCQRLRASLGLPQLASRPKPL
ncbi:MAG: YkgJ family cysteine cluster protein [Bordetella sp.]|uniref:YkgJ family cysteine cluster protein n=1 Tax=Bordetella sp. TaxID=28081 RepID=UPI003F7C67A9